MPTCLCKSEFVVQSLLPQIRLLQLFSASYIAKTPAAQPGARSTQALRKKTLHEIENRDMTPTDHLRIVYETSGSRVSDLLLNLVKSRCAVLNGPFLLALHFTSLHFHTSPAKDIWSQ